MKNKSAIIAVAGSLSLISSVAFASVLASEKDLVEKINENVAQKHAADAKKYNRVAALSGGKIDKLTAKNNEAVNAYSKWRELKSATESSGSDAEKFRALEAGTYYAKVNKEFIDMQKDILVKMSDSVSVAEAINALNATAPSAAGR